MLARVRVGRGLYRLLWARLAYQFEPRAADAILGDGSELEASLGGRGRVRHVWRRGELLLTFRAGDSMASLSPVAGELLRRAVEPPRFRVIVRRGAEVRGSVFASQVVGGDPLLRPGDEVLVVDEDDVLIAVGRVRLPLTLIRGLARGEVVRIR